jgi:hypothetical protein
LLQKLEEALTERLSREVYSRATGAIEQTRELLYFLVERAAVDAFDEAHEAFNHSVGHLCARHLADAPMDFADSLRPRRVCDTESAALQHSEPHSTEAAVALRL